MTSKKEDYGYGPNENLIRNFIAALRSYAWFENIRKPHPLDNEVRRVYTIKQAFELLPLTKDFHVSITRQRIQAGRVAYELTHRSFKRFSGAAGTDAYDTVYEVVGTKKINNKKVNRELIGLAAADAYRAASELVYVDIIPEPPHLALDLTSWYREGHWPLGRDNNGVLIVL